MPEAYPMSSAIPDANVFAAVPMGIVARLKGVAAPVRGDIGRADRAWSGIRGIVHGADIIARASIVRLVAEPDSPRRGCGTKHLDNRWMPRQPYGMRKSEWPGITTAVGIVLILTLIVVGSRDDFHLKDWQTVVAAIIAFGAGTLAYRGAMAKVNEDRDRERRELDRRKLGLYLRLRFGLERLSDHAAANELVIVPLEEDDGTRRVNPMVEVKRLRLDNREELEEAWNNLDLLPSAVAAEIDWLRRQLLMMDEMLADLPPQTLAMEFVIPTEYHGGYRQACIELRSHADMAIVAINRAIGSLKIS
jgi:hypothetical protein